MSRSSLNERSGAWRELLTLAAMFLLLVVVATLPTSAQSEGGDDEPTLAEVLDRHLEAKGGREAVAAFRTAKVIGQYTAFSDSAPFIMLWEWPDHLRFEHAMLGNPVVAAHDGEVAWWLNPVFDSPWPLRMPGPEAAVFADDGDLVSPLLEASIKSSRIELIGRAEVDGIDCWHLEVTRRTGRQQSWFLDAETFLERAVYDQGVESSQLFPRKIYFDDFREVAGVRMPFWIEHEFFMRHRVFEIESIEANPEVAPEQFIKPVDAAMARLAPMVGKWTVAVESRSSPRAEWSEQTTRSTVVAKLDGSLLEESLSFEIGARPTTVHRTWSFDPFREQYRLTHTDDLNGYLNLHEGSFESPETADDSNDDEASGGMETAERLVLSNVERGLPIESGGRQIHSRVTLDLNPETAEVEFRITGELSVDGGETWFEALRLTYSK